MIARASDAGLGLPIEHAIRTCLLSVELGRRLGLGTGDLADLYYLSLLRMLGCTAGSTGSADLFGDEVRFGADTQHLDYGDPAAFGEWVMQNFASDRDPAVRQAMIENLFSYTPQRRREALTGHCEVAKLLAAGLGATAEVVAGLAQVFERFDGAGAPFGVQGADLPEIVRVMTLCNEIEVHHRLGGPDAAQAMARDRSGGAFDPDMVTAFCADSDALLAVVVVPAGGPALWDDLLNAEPGQPRYLAGDQVFDAARVLGEFGDLKSPHLAGHACAVARLAQRAADRAAIEPATREALILAALVHDLGRVTVTTTIWDKQGRLSESEWEQVRLHPYYSERFLAPARSLADVAALAGRHHERLDGSGYHRGDRRTALSPAARLLAAVDVYTAMRAARAHRPALEPDEAGDALRRMAQDDLLDTRAVNCVLAAAGDTAPPVRRRWPAGLTDREVDVLRQVATGGSIQQTAAALHLSAKTVDFHLQNIYAKAGVTTRAAAAVFAVQQDLLPA